MPSTRAKGGGKGGMVKIEVYRMTHLDFPEPLFLSLSGKTTALIASSNTCFNPKTIG